jgi:hypothetical protein
MPPKLGRGARGRSARARTSRLVSGSGGPPRFGPPPPCCAGQQCGLVEPAGGRERLELLEGVLEPRRHRPSGDLRGARTAASPGWHGRRRPGPGRPRRRGAPSSLRPAGAGEARYRRVRLAGPYVRPSGPGPPAWIGRPGPSPGRRRRGITFPAPGGGLMAPLRQLVQSAAHRLRGRRHSDEDPGRSVTGRILPGTPASSARRGRSGSSQGRGTG